MSQEYTEREMYRVKNIQNGKCIESGIYRTGNVQNGQQEKRQVIRILTHGSKHQKSFPTSTA